MESGRAGRDGLPSECVLFFRPADVPRQSSMVFYENSGLKNLYDIVRYCQSKRECRRSAFFRHFAESLQECNGMCDNCAFSNEVKELDVSSHAKLIVSMLKDIQENAQRVTMLQLVEKLKVNQKNLGSDLKKDELEQLVIKLILDHVLKEEYQHTAYATNAYVTVGPLAMQVLQGKKIITVEMSTRQSRTSSSTRSSKRERSSGLDDKLDELRKELASIHGGIFAHSVLSMQQISTLTSKKPKSIEELEKIIGKLKTEKYGSRILEEIASYKSDPQQDADGSKESKGNAVKKLKTKKALVVLESSEDEA